MVKKAEETTAKEEVKEIPKVEFRTAKGKNFVGFVHPNTRTFISVDEDGKILVDPDDEKALKILRSAADIVEI